MLARRLLFRAAAAASAGPLLMAPRQAAASVQGESILSFFDGLPGNLAIKILAPATDAAPQLLISHNAADKLFVGSAFKTFVLAKTLIQADTPNVVATLSAQQLTLDETVWSSDSAVFNPPNLTGKVSVRTTLEAMIMHSDNTATDMALKNVGPDNVRQFVASAGLRSVSIPDSTRSFIGYLLGAADYKTFTWAELQAATSAPVVNTPLNDVETMASSANDLVSFYQRALPGAFFANPQTLNEFRRILTLGDAIFVVPFPLGVSAFCKGGSIDVPGFHGLCVPGGLYFNNRWVYFCFTLNWDAESETDPTTAAAFAHATSQALGLLVQNLSA